MPRRTRRSTAQSRSRAAATSAQQKSSNTPQLYGDEIDSAIPDLDNLNDLLQQPEPIVSTPSSVGTTPGAGLNALNPDFADSYQLTPLEPSRANTKARAGAGGAGKAAPAAAAAAAAAAPTSATGSNGTTTVKKTKKTAPAKRPAFVMKLWNMVNDPSNSKYIGWLPDGKAFQVNDRENFMKYVLPKYFKHNNFASFVRQLNMYGWHKIQDVNSGSLMQGDEVWQFENPNFQRDREDLLDKIARNKPSKETEEEDVDIPSLLHQLEEMRDSQKMIEDDLRRVKEDNEILWKENYMVRERHKLQSQTLDKILRFLATVYGNSSTKFLEDMTSHNNAAGSDLDVVPASQNAAVPIGVPSGAAASANSGLQPQAHGAGAQGNMAPPPRENSLQGELYGYRYGEATPASRRQLMISNKAYSPTETPMGASESTESAIQEIHRGPENRNSDPFANVGDDINFDSPGGSITGLTPVGSVSAGNGQYYPDYQMPRTNSLLGPDGKPSSLSSNPEELMGNIHSQLNRNQSQLKQVNEWISRLSTGGGKPSEDMDELNDLLLPQGFDPTADDLSGLYDSAVSSSQPAGAPDVPAAAAAPTAATTTAGSHKRRATGLEAAVGGGKKRTKK